MADKIIKTLIADKTDGTKYLSRNNTLIKAIYVSTVIESKIIDQALFDVQQTNQLRINYTTQELAQYINLPLGNAIYPILHKAVEHLLNCKVILHDATSRITEGFVIITYCCYDNGIFTLEINSHVLPYLINPAPPFTKGGSF